MPAPMGVVEVMTAAAEASAASGGRGAGVGGGRRIQRQHHHRHPQSSNVPSAHTPSAQGTTIITMPHPAMPVLPAVDRAADGPQLAFDSPASMRRTGVEGPSEHAVPTIRLARTAPASFLTRPTSLPRALPTLTGTAGAATVVVGAGEVGLGKGGEPREFPHPADCGGPLNSSPRGPATTLQISLQQRRTHAGAPGGGKLRGRIPSARGSTGQGALNSAGVATPTVGVGPPTTRPWPSTTTAAPRAARSVEEATSRTASAQRRGRRATSPPTREWEAVDHARPPRATSPRASMNIAMTNSSATQPTSMINEATRIGFKAGARSRTRSTAVRAMFRRPFQVGKANVAGTVGGGRAGADDEHEQAHEEPARPGGRAARPKAGCP